MICAFISFVDDVSEISARLNDQRAEVSASSFLRNFRSLIESMIARTDYRCNSCVSTSLPYAQLRFVKEAL